MKLFETTYKENYPRLFSTAKKIVTDEDVIHDIIQEVFISYYIKQQQNVLISFPGSWLLQATINKCIDYVKRSKKHTGLTEAGFLEAEKDEALEKHQSKEVLKEAISSLKPIQIKMIVLYSEGYSYQEISSLTGVKFTSVGKTLSRSLEKLKKTLKELNYEMY